jgi:8-oxo-dGTP diphosphatase
MQKGLIVHTLISNNKGEVLILQRSTKDDVLPGYWDLPGGTLEDGEDPSRGAIREVKEETSLDIKDVKLFFHTSNVDVSKNKQFVTLIFHAKISGDEVVINPSEHEKYKWINPTDISEYKTVHYLADCLKEYLKYLFLS